MESDPLLAAATAIGIVLDPTRLMFLSSGVLMGLVLGIIPGLGGLVGLSILLPFTFALDPFTAIAMLLGLSAVTVTSDTIPAVLFSVPGTVGSAATILDGYPMAQKGEAGRALGAAFTASVIGGLFGAVVLGVSIPILRPLVLLIGSPELLAICIVGLSMVAALSGGAPLKGMAAVCIGILVATVGEDSQTATLRWTFDTNYLWDGLPIVPFALGMFAIPEIADMVVSRKGITGDTNVGNRWSQLQGVRDVFKNYFLVLRCASIGAILGAIPGMGAAVIDWIAYGHAARTEKGASETFGTGDVRGVIASEASNNAKEGGALIPTIAFGVPGSVSMALLLGAFLIHDINPGPDLLTKRLDVTYTMVWSVAIANILGAGICFLFANQLAKIVLIRIGILAPLIIAVVYIGVFQASNAWGDWYALLGFSLLGWVMKRMNWPRPPVILGFVLGGLIENYMFISIQRYDFEWLSFPIVMVLLAFALVGILRPTVRSYLEGRRQPKARRSFRFVRPSPKERPDTVFTGIVIVFFSTAILSSLFWELEAKLMPWAVAWAGIGFGLMHFIGRFISFGAEAPKAAAGNIETHDPGGDTTGIVDHIAALTTREMLRRAGNFLGWCLLYLALTALIGLLPAMLVFLVSYMRFQGRESWRMTLTIAIPTWIFAYLLFHRIVAVVWPKSFFGDWFPVIRSFQSLNFL
ncbi:MAG: tripartite tricarboxylate transporter permease [Rhodospirillaceae bacterium]|nr:tripartite tricarboxylate transporter permease [Rhodospirillaceae bacterium]